MSSLVSWSEETWLLKVDRSDVEGVPAALDCNILLDHSMIVWGTSAIPLSTGLSSPVRLGPCLLLIHPLEEETTCWRVHWRIGTATPPQILIGNSPVVPQTPADSGLMQNRNYGSTFLMDRQYEAFLERHV